MYKLYCRAYQLVFRCATPLLPWRRPVLLKDFASVARLLREKGIQSALVVTDAGLVKLGLHARLLAAIESASIHCAMYDKTAQNPTIDNIEEALALYKREGCAAIIALGGGSPMDCAKGVGARLARPGKTITQMRGLLKVLKKIPPLIAIPTTAGTGSETTVAAIITDSASHEKYAVNDPVLIPHYALLEPSLTVGLPPHITAWTGMDALCHAVEAYTNRSNTRQTRQDALEATRLIFQNLPLAFANGQDVAARRNMQEAAFLAGAAFTRAYVGNIHAVAHTLGGQYGTQHGLANAVIMPYVLDIYGEEIHKPLSELATAAGITQPSASMRENAEKFIAAIRTMNVSMGIPDRLADLQERDIPTLAARALREANPLYPVPVIFDQPEMEKVYRCLLERKSEAHHG